jgi:hypothetical protein
VYKYLPVIVLLLCLRVSAQLPEDALRASWTTPGGTARAQAIGGAMGSIGGDITAGFVNPAGLGLYKTSEIVVSPSLRFLLDKSNYLGSAQNGPNVHRFNMGASGIVLSLGANPEGSSTLAIAVNRTADFNSHVTYHGVNAYSSFAEQYAEEFSNSGLDINSGIASPALDYGTRMALYTYLIDTATIGGVPQVIALPNSSGKLLQQNDIRSKGGITEIELSLASSQHDKWYFGGSLGIPILNYTRYQTYSETDLSGNPNNDFASFTYRETYTTSGAGLNAKLGAIYSPSAPWRIGLAIHTPNALVLTDHITASMVTNTENYTSLKQISINSDSIDQLTGLSPRPNAVSYDLYTPWHFLLSGSYIVGSGETDTKKQKGFITADLEYITTHDPHYTTDNSDNQVSVNNNYYDQVNQAIKETYKGTWSARLGGEIKLDKWMLRAGGAYYSNPYSQPGIKADRLYGSTGLGYRVKAFFADLAYTMVIDRNIDVPYRLADKSNSYAAVRETGGALLLTVGMKW